MQKTQAIIRFEDVDEQALDQKSHDDYFPTLTLLMGALFSRYPERRDYSHMRLERYWGKQLELAALTSDGDIYTYIRFEDEKKYTYVATFSEASPVLELVPSDEEIDAWSLERVLHYSDMRYTSHG